MARSSPTLDIYLEIGKKRVFACAVDWPGWSRIGRDENGAQRALLDSAPRYAQVLASSPIPFQPPAAASDLVVVERLDGDANTDFGAPGVAPPSDARPVDDAELERFGTLLQAYWRAFDAAVRAAQGKELRKGPRGGGRDLPGIREHVLGAEAGYLARLAWKMPKLGEADVEARQAATRAAVLQALRAAARGETPERGPRGGTIWTPRYFVRRLGWHALDHTWEIEDRSA